MISCEVVQGEAGHTNNSMHWGTVIAVIICVDAIFIFCRHGLAFLLINCAAGSLIIMNMAEESQINLDHVQNTVLENRMQPKMDKLMI
jgi:hypothetical protein